MEKSASKDNIRDESWEIAVSAMRALRLSTSRKTCQQGQLDGEDGDDSIDCENILAETLPHASYGENLKR